MTGKRTSVYLTAEQRQQIESAGLSIADIFRAGLAASTEHVHSCACGQPVVAAQIDSHTDSAQPAPKPRTAVRAAPLSARLPARHTEPQRQAPADDGSLHTVAAPDADDDAELFG